ncbi:MAG: Rne/Rng family ribonuclease [Desulfuromonadaceae bacterium]|nr:Rne/Rng family ribonuclease [Geobacteraceae bacterium]
MSKKMLINATLSGEERVAIVEDGLLTELDIEVAGSENTKGNIYKAEVIRVEAGLQAAFVNYGAQRHGFLQIGDIHPDLWPKRNGNNSQRPPINEILRRGQQILVQVVKEERGTKGAAVTTELSLAGRYMVLMANSRSRGISRKIDKDSTRKKIKEALKELDLPDEMGYIIRTAAIDQSSEELRRDFNYLFNIYKNIISQAENASAPALVYQESSLVLRSVRDYFTPDMDEVLIDDNEIFKQTRDFIKTVMPDYVKLVKMHQERRPIFARYQIEEQIAQLATNSVNLPSGGSIVLDQTEALVAIDVNSGKVSSEQSIESTACLVNVEAATEIARQLRLRDLGGLVVIDFIDMRQRKNARKVEKTLEQALKQDKARITQGRISSLFGLLEMSRQRIKPNLGASSYNSCPNCSGSGRIRSCESRAISLLRRIQAGTAKGKIDQVVANVALDVGTLLLNQKRAELKELEQQQHVEIWIKPRPDYLPDQVDLDFSKNSVDLDDSQGEQKALVDMDYSDRSWDSDSDTDNSKDKESSTAEQEKGSEAQSDSSKQQQGEAASAQESPNQSSEIDGAQKEDSKNDSSNKPRRPRRSRSARQRRARADAKAQEQENQTPSDSDTDASAAEQNPQTQEEKPAATGDAAAPTTEEKDSTAQSAPARRKPSSGRTRRKKPETPPEIPEATQSNAGDDAQAVPSQTQEAPAPEDKSTQEGATGKPKRAPRRSPSRKKAQSNSTDETGTQDQSSEKTEEQPTPARKRAPARRRATPKDSSAASPSDAEITSESAASAAAPRQDEDKSSATADNENKKAPAPRKRTPRKRTPSKEATTPASNAAATEIKEDSGAQSVSKDQAPQGKDDSTVIEKANGAQETVAKKTSPTRRRRTPSKSASAASTEEGTSPEEATVPKKTPRRRASTSRSKSSATASAPEIPKQGRDAKPDTAATASDGGTEGEAKPAPKRTPRRTTTRRSSSKSATTPQAEETGEQKGATDAKSSPENNPEATQKRRRTSTRKSTPPKTEDDA